MTSWPYHPVDPTPFSNLPAGTYFLFIGYCEGWGRISYPGGGLAMTKAGAFVSWFESTRLDHVPSSGGDCTK